VHVDDAALNDAIAGVDAAYPKAALPEAAAVLEALAAKDGETPADEEVEAIELTAAPEAEPESRPPAKLVVGETLISTSLYQILLEETAQLLDALRREHSVLEFEPRARPSEAMVRAAHTLTGIHRTAGFPPVADLAGALESALLTLQHQSVRHDSMLPVLADAAQSLAELVDFIGMRQSFAPSALHHAAQARTRLATLQETSGGLTADSETLAAQAALADEPAAETPRAAAEQMEAAPAQVTPAAIELEPTPEIAELRSEMPGPVENEMPIAVPEAEFEPTATRASEIPEPIAESRQVAMAVAEQVGSVVPHTLVSAGEALASVRDDLDPQLLPIFLEEAQELFPRAGSLLRDWRRAPGNTGHSRDLRRTLHTLKGSARMAGAMRLGELTHLMESRLLVGEREVAPSTELFDALDGDLDHLAALIDQLQTGAPAMPAEAQPELQGETVVSMAPLPTEGAARATVAAEEHVAEGEMRERATVRVRTDIIDRLVNETGELSIARERR
jgi:chemosensory pili system protein ChpA (sensor histidine kinase/response regulator)